MIEVKINNLERNLKVSAHEINYHTLKIKAQPTLCIKTVFSRPQKAVKSKSKAMKTKNVFNHLLISRKIISMKITEIIFE